MIATPVSGGLWVILATPNHCVIARHMQIGPSASSPSDHNNKHHTRHSYRETNDNKYNKNMATFCCWSFLSQFKLIITVPGSPAQLPMTGNDQVLVLGMIFRKSRTENWPFRKNDKWWRGFSSCVQPPVSQGERGGVTELDHPKLGNIKQMLAQLRPLQIRRNPSPDIW